MLLLALACVRPDAPKDPKSSPPLPSPEQRSLVAMLHGGGPEDDALFGRFVEESGAGHIVTLGSSDPQDPDLLFFDGYFVSLGARSASTINTDGRPDEASALKMASEIDLADAIFIRGGDQAAYLEEWSLGPIHEALLRARDRKAPIAGTSAGCALLGERIYDARVSSLDSWEALDDPFDPGVTFSKDLLDLLPGILTDTHFTERGRLGRLAAFVARLRYEGEGDILGLGVDPETSLYVYSDSTAEVAGTGSITVLGPEAALGLQPGAPASIREMAMWQLPAGYTIDLRSLDLVLSRPDYVSPVEAPSALDWPAAIIDGNDLDARLLGDNVIPEIDEPDYPWYRGRLTERPADKVLPGSFVLTRLYDDSDRFEAHIGGTLWTLARHPGTIGIGVDIGHRARILETGEIAVDDGWALVIDTRTATHAGDPERVPQTVAIEGARLSVIAEGERLALD